MSHIRFSSIQELSFAFTRREVSYVDVSQSYLKAIQEGDTDIHAYLDVYEDVVDTAKRLDAGAKRFNGILAGIPIAVKDNILIKGRRASCGSKILDTYVASYDATVIAKLKEHGALFLGKTNMDEFAMGSSTENSAFGVTKNPHDRTRVSGGSSGGSAAAVAAGLSLAAIGSDTGGSIRQPASFCGVVGFKPSYGAISRSGLMAMASSLDQIGPLTRSVADARIMFHAMRGRDELDATTVDVESRKSEVESSPLDVRRSAFNLRRVRVGVPKEYFGKGLDPDVETVIRSAIRECESLGCEIRDVSLPHAEYGLATYYVVMPAEVSSNLARFDGIRYGYASDKASTLLEVYEKSRSEGFGPEAKRRIMLGTFILSHGYYDAYYVKAQKVRSLIRDDFERVFADVDVIVGPTSPTPAFRIGEKTMDPLAMYLADIYTVGANLAGIPAISIPAGSVKRDGVELPVGFQAMGRWFRDDALLDFAEAIEARLPKPRFDFPL